MKVVVKEDNNLHKKIVLDYLVTIKINLNIDFEILFIDNLDNIIQTNTIEDNIINIIDVVDNNDPFLNGVNVATKIREINRTSYIIFLTSHESYLSEVVNSFIQPIAYIHKSDSNASKLLLAVFKKIIYNDYQSEKSIKLSFKDEESNIVYIYLNSIYMIYTSLTRQKYINIVAQDKTYTVRGKISEYENIYPNLIRCNKSTLVNKNKIEKVLRGSTPKNKIIKFGSNDSVSFPDCYLSAKYKDNLL